MCTLQKNPSQTNFGYCLVSNLLGKKGCSHRKGGYGLLWKEFDPKLTAVRFQPSVQSGSLVVEADIFTDGHDSVAGEILYRYEREEVWRRSPMKPVGIDRWRGDFLASKVGKYYYTIEGWIDRFGTWRNAMIKRIDSGQDIRIECLIGAGIAEEAASRAAPEDAARLHDWIRILRDERSPEGGKQSRSRG